ncbi:MAG: hypothetical protein IJ479_00050 [Alphaproteobacteria bacterium]|nr:hypothetical protein [Alphaproteobacteria bacterium]
MAHQTKALWQKTKALFLSSCEFIILCSLSLFPSFSGFLALDNTIGNICSSKVKMLEETANLIKDIDIFDKNCYININRPARPLVEFVFTNEMMHN